METLHGKTLEHLELQNSLIRIMDIVYFEGPLLTLFENIVNKHLYLLDWVGRDNQFNRWLIYRCTPILLDKYIKNDISHLDLFMSDEPYCYKIDIDKHLVWQNFQKIEKKSLPNNYLPDSDVFFETSDCPNLSKLQLFVNYSKQAQLQENLFVNNLIYHQTIKSNREKYMSVMTETTVIDGNSLIHVVHENKINASKYTSFSKAVKTKTVQNI